MHLFLRGIAINLLAGISCIARNTRRARRLRLLHLFDVWRFMRGMHLRRNVDFVRPPVEDLN